MSQHLQTLKDILRKGLDLSGIKCDGNLTFSKWNSTGDNIGVSDVLSVSDFRHSLKDCKIYFLELEDVSVIIPGPHQFFVSYIGINLTYAGISWEGQPYTEEEELPHDIKLSQLKERIDLVNQKILGVLSLITEISLITPEN